MFDDLVKDPIWKISTCVSLRCEFRVNIFFECVPLDSLQIPEDSKDDTQEIVEGFAEVLENSSFSPYPNNSWHGVFMDRLKMVRLSSSPVHWPNSGNSDGKVLRSSVGFPSFVVWKIFSEPTILFFQGKP